MSRLFLRPESKIQRAFLLLREFDGKIMLEVQRYVYDIRNSFGTSKHIVCR